MPVVDKQVTIRLDVRDNLTPALRVASAESTRLAAAAAKASTATTRLGDAKGPAAAATQMGAAARSAGLLATSAGRAQTAVGLVGRAGAGVVAAARGFDRSASSAQRFESAILRVNAASKQLGVSAGAKLAPLNASLVNGAEAADRARAKYQALGDASRTVAIGSAAAAVGVGAMVRQYSEFDSAMSRVSAATMMSGAALETFRDKAISAGADTQYSAREAADGITEMAKAGVSASDILDGGLNGSLALAAAGQLDVAEAAETSSAALVQFGLRGSDLGHVSDLLAAGAGKAMGSVHDMGMALNQTGLVASQTGLSLEETTGGLAAFASAGLVGSDAGTSFKTMLQRLNPTTKEAKDTMAALGISAYDQNGSFIGLANVAGQLQNSMAGLSAEQRSAAMNTIFGSDAVRAANVLYENGAQGIQKWIDKVNDAGYAQRQAAALTNNLSGDFERLTGSIDSVVMKSGSGLNQFLRDMTQGAEKAVDAIGAIPAPVLKLGVGVAATGASVGLLVGGIGMMVPHLAAGRAALAGVAAQAGLTSAALSGLGGAFAVVAGAAAMPMIADGLASFSQAKPPVDALQQSLVNLGTGTGDVGRFLDVVNPRFDVFGAGADTAAQGLERFGLSARTLANDGTLNQVLSFGGWQASTSAFKAQITELDTALAGLVANGHTDQAKASFDKLMDATKYYGGNVEQVSALFAKYQQASAAAEVATGRQSAEQVKAAAAAKGMTVEQYKATQSLEEFAKKAEEAAKQVKDFQSAVESLGASQRNESGSVRDYEAALDAMDAALKKNGATLDVSTEKGRENQASWEAIAASGAGAASKILQNGGSVAQAASAVNVARQDYIRFGQALGKTPAQAAAAADAMGLTADAVVELASRYGQIPPFITTSVELAGYETVKARLGEVAAALVFDPPPPIQVPLPVVAPFVGAMQAALGVTKMLAEQNPTVNVGQTGAPGVVKSMSDVIAAAGKADKSDPNVKTSETGAAPTKGKLDKTTAAAQRLGQQRPTPRVSVAGVDTAQAEINRLLSGLSRIERTAVTASVRIATMGPLGALGMAHGGVIESYANGGIRRENHVAQIAKAGAWRVWAEEETGGEAYIPLAPGKRARSVAILEEVARRFGMSVMSFASGGLMGEAVRLPASSGTVQGIGLQGVPVIPVVAQVTKVVIPKNVSAPFLYTPGGKWDRSTPLPEVATSRINELFQKLYVSKDELAELAKAAGEARANASKAGIAVPGYGGATSSGASASVGAKMVGALASAPAQIRSLISATAAKYGLSANLVAAVVKAESGFAVNARSGAGAQGLMQLMPGTARALGVKNAYNAAQNIEGGVKYLAQLTRQFNGDVAKALAAYNAGPGRVLSGRALPKETQSYVKKILADPGVKAGSAAPAPTLLGTAGGGMSASAGASTAGKAAGVRVAAANAAFTKSMAATVKAKTTPNDARAAAIANALSMNGRGSYKWGGGHTSTYYKNSAALAADCSGFVGWAIGHAIGKNVTGTSGTMLGNNRSLGYVKIDPKIAAKTAGALMGHTGHVVMSLGDGRVVESYQTGKPVRIRALRKSDYQVASWNTALGSMTQATAAQVTGGKVGASTAAGGSAPTAKDVQEYAEAQKAYADALAASKIAPHVQLMRATTSATTYSRQFLSNIAKIRDRGYPEVAARILEMGEADGAAVAASFATAPDKDLRNQRANYAQNAGYTDMAQNLKDSLGQVRGAAAWQTATREGVRDNTRWKQFLDNVDRVRSRGYTTLAARLLDMGLEDGYDIARQAATLPDKDVRNLRDAITTGRDALQEREDNLKKIALGPLWRQDMTSVAKATAASAAFLANIRRIRERGFTTLALRLMEMGEDSAAGMAKEAATAADKDLATWQTAGTASEAMQKEAQALLDQLKGIGMVLNVPVGATTGVDPQVRFTAPRPIDARPVAPSRTVDSQGAASGRSGPLVQVENVYAADPRAAIREMETQMGDAAATYGLDLVGA